MKSYTLMELAQRFNLELQNCADPHRLISGLGTLQKADHTQIAFLENSAYLKYLPHTRAAAVILKPVVLNNIDSSSLLSQETAALFSNNPYLIYAQTAELFNHRPPIKPGIHPTALIGENCEIHRTASIGAYCIIGSRCKIGAQTALQPRVTLCDETIIGENCLIHSGAVIGSDGFGNARDGIKWVKVPQLGRAVIGSRVEIGANTTIDRGSLEDTVIEDGVRLDNQIQIAHNVKIGADTAIAACTGIAGSAEIGKRCMIGGAAGINGHIKMCDDVIITAMSAVTKSIKTPGVYSSTPAAQKNSEWRKMTVRLRHLDKLFERVKNLEARKNDV